MTAMEFTLGWRCDHARHTDCLVAPQLDLRCDVLPPALKAQLLGRPAGHRAAAEFAPGELLPSPSEAEVLTVPQSAFNRRLRRHRYVEPHAGRFYPRAFIAGVRDIAPNDRRPFRVGRLEPQLVIDLNHPLAGRPLTLAARVLDVWRAGDAPGERCNDLAQRVTADGPGMQARWRKQPTDFFCEQPFARLAGEADAAFYARPRLVDHLDRTATAQVETLYGRLIPTGARILDLMSSWKSHLPAALAPAEVAGLGMNPEELAANPLLGERLVHDLNLAPRLPFEDERFDAVVCTVSVEYLTQPFEVFAEVRRVLRPGGRFITTFSNRWFPPKVIHAWQDTHEFERPGLLLEYFLRTGGFRDLETFSLRGLPRPQDDQYADRLADADPVYAVWGSKA
jgi:SAM-dependent methyltransferase/FKBP-type peptidyl-prolyl cis-trans isomerase 2